MSKKVVIERVQVRGAAPYLGMSATPDGQQVPLYSTNPDIVMRWLCDGWRCRYNQLRSRRTKWDRESQIGYHSLLASSLSCWSVSACGS